MARKTKAAKVTTPTVLPPLAEYMTVEQCAEESADKLSYAQIRWMLFHRKASGLDACIVRIGRRLYIHRERFRLWVEAQREAA